MIASTWKKLTALVSSAPAVGNQLPREFQQRIKTMIFKNAYIGIVAGYSALVGLLFIDWQRPGPSYVLEWAVAMFFMTTARLCSVVFGGRQTTEKGPSRAGFNGYYFFSALEGWGWGLSMFLIFPSDVLYQSVLLIVLIGLAVGGLAVFSGSSSLSALFAIAIIFTADIKLFSLPFASHGVLALLAPVLLGVLLIVGHRMNGLLVDTLFLTHKYEQLALIEAASKQSIVDFSEKLSAKTAEVEKVTGRLKRLVNLASEDLRNNLVTLCQFSAFLTEETRAPYEQQHIISTVQKMAKKSLQSVDDLLKLTGIDVSQTIVDLRSQNFGKLIETVLGKVLQAADDKGVFVETMLEDERAVNVDSEKMERVLTKLIGNAIRYSPSQGTVTIRTLSTDHGLRVEVVDGGVGIDPERMATLFNGRQGNGANAGKGLDFAVAQKILQAHNSLLEVDNNPTAGCCFAFTLPW